MRHIHPRIFLPPEQLEAEIISLYGDDYHHLAHALRMREGDLADLGDGRGQTATARVSGIFRDHLDLLVERTEFVTRTPPSLHLFQGVTKGSKLAFVVRANVELGVDEITPFVSGRSVPEDGPGGARLERLRKIALEAAKQSRRAYLPEVNEPLGMSGLARRLKEFGLAVVAWEKESRRASEILPAVKPQSAALVIGPEGGFSLQEIEELREQGALTVGLGPYVLRTETAGLVLQAIIRCHFGML